MRIEQLTFTRFLAAISIVVYHYGINVFPFNSNAVDFLFRQANIGVSYFFILSGFVMIIAYGKNVSIDFSDYMKRRFARIYPVYILSILILLSYFIIHKISIDYTGLLLNIAMIQSWTPGYAISFNGPGWSLAVEMFFYLSFPLLFNQFFKKYSLKKLIFPIIVFFIISQTALHVLLNSSFYKGYPSHSHDLIFYFPLMHFSEFLIGNLAGIFFLNGIKIRNYDLPVMLLITLIIILLQLKTNINYHNGMLAFAFIPLIVLMAANNGFLTIIFNNKILAFLGEISFGIYILQKPVFIWVHSIMKNTSVNNAAIIFYSSLMILILIASVSYKYFEKPLRKIMALRKAA
jgi:peptidoglycan/LPS O-acetylase OafA/YrhL